MRHKGFLSSASDACRRRGAGTSQIAQQSSIAGPSRLPLSLPPPISTPSRPALTSQLPFLYPPSCLELAHTTSIRAKSSLAPTSSVSAAAAATATAAATAHDDHHEHHHHHHRHAELELEPDFSFLRHHYDPPHHLIDHPPSHALIQQDADSHLEPEVPPSLPAQQVVSPSIRAQHRSTASAANLLSLRRKSHSLRQSLQHGQTADADAIVKQCRRLVLQACRINSPLHARTARAIASDTITDCALSLAAAAHPLQAASVLRHLLVKLSWNPRSTCDSEPSPSASSAPSTASARLLLVVQGVISQLTLAPCSFSPRPVRRFESQHHFDAATSLVSAMHLGHMARSTASQTALIRAMIASGEPRLAVQTFAAEVRAWWSAHRQAKRRPQPLLRRQAALVVDIGKPSSQALREITRALQNLEELLSRVRPDLFSQLSEREQQAIHAKRAEYADSLVQLIRLVRGGRLPLPPTPSAPEIAWILSACCRFESTMLLGEATAANSTPPALDAAQRRKLKQTAQMIRYYLCEYMQDLPDGQTRSAGNLLVQGDPVIRPALGTAVYNQLVHYALSVLKLPSMCKQVFQHMTEHRQPPLEPDAVTFNTILRQATTQRYEALARAVLTTRRPEQSQASISVSAHEQQGGTSRQSSSGNTATGARTAQSATSTPGFDGASADTALRPIRPMIQQIDTAVVQADSYRLASLLQYVTASGLFLRRYRHEPGHIGVMELVMRIYPALNKQRHAPSRDADSLAPLRPKANQASRHAILNPHVLTATLNLAAKAGKTGLALRIWRLIKRTSLQSALQSPAIDVAKTPWKVPVEAATILMSVLASEAARAPKARHPLRMHRQRSPLGAPRILASRTSRLAARREYARGWNIVASLRGRASAARSSPVGQMYSRTAEFGEGLRWRAAQLLAKREYLFLVHHWQLSQTLTSSRRQQLDQWLQPSLSRKAAAASGAKTRGVARADDVRVQPDSRFYDAVLDVFGRRPGMVQRSRRHNSRSEVLSQLRRGYSIAHDKAAAASSTELEAHDAKSGDVESGLAREESGSAPAQRLAPVGAAHAHALSPNQLLNAVVARISWNSRGRWTSVPPDAFLVRILMDMQTLGIDIPVGYRWILTHCAVAASSAALEHVVPRMLQNDDAAARSKGQQRAFSPFRGPRVKTVGLVARRRS
ncbi:conserved hypothetical protein [Sporisorium reilianum SRZ2]|uniref:Uncharacterized protein n=1 Tax=Sporisorium reilianum (strain SRZ2) TaxID=999809 RepID=E6ZW52_SPORE|nr:conserved hypothetical protein [Sporisorium reilianum SRZ2]